MMKYYRSMTNIWVLALVVLLLACYILFLAPTLTARAAEGTQFETGMLVDEAFVNLRGDWTSSTFDKNKATGWEVDTSGGTYSYVPAYWFKITDNSTVDGVTFKKEFVSQTQGKITFYYRFKMPEKADGTSWQLNSGEVAGVKVFTSGGNLCYEDSNGSPVTLQLYNANMEYGVKVVADISSKTADIFVNGTQRAAGVSFRNAVNNLNYVYINTGDSQMGEMYLTWRCDIARRIEFFSM